MTTCNPNTINYSLSYQWTDPSHGPQLLDQGIPLENHVQETTTPSLEFTVNLHSDGASGVNKLPCSYGEFKRTVRQT